MHNVFTLKWKLVVQRNTCKKSILFDPVKVLRNQNDEDSDVLKN